jgi:hypothetical protein
MMPEWTDEVKGETKDDVEGKMMPEIQKFR